MSALHFPSGPWTGFYTYSAKPGQHRMDLTLHFANGRVTGDGLDPVGRFAISGGFDAASGECHWTKSYVGAHDVFYRGFREGKGIWGTWEIHQPCRGGFQIWPLGEENAEELELIEEEPIEVGVTAPRALIRRSRRR